MMGKERLSKEGYVLMKGESQRNDGLFSYRWTDESGKRMEMYAKTLVELRTIESRVRIAERKGLIDYVSTTVNDLFEIWSDLKHGVQENTMYNYRQVYGHYVMHSVGKKKMLEVRPTDIKRFYYALHDSRGLSFNTLDHIQNVLFQVLQIAVDEGYLIHNPAANALKDLKREKGVPKREIQALELEQEQGFLDYCKSNLNLRRWYPIFAVMLGTGLRVGELCALRKKDIDFKNGFIHVNQTLTESGEGRHIHCPKTKSASRKIPMIRSVRKALSMEKRYQKKNGLKCNVEIDGVKDFFFLNRFGGVHNQQSINSAIRRAVTEYNCRILETGGNKKLMVPVITSHVFRKTFITRMCESGMNIRDIMQIAGHADIQTTMAVYTKVTERMQQLDMDKLEEYLTC